MNNNTMSKSHFDEMQLQIRHKAGYQSFFLLYFMLMFDLLLTDHISWAGTTESIVIIMLLSFAYFMVKIVSAGAYSGTQTKKGKKTYVVFSLAIVAITFFLAILKQTNFFKESINFSDGGILRLIIYFVIFFSIVIISNRISKNKSMGD